MRTGKLAAIVGAVVLLVDGCTDDSDVDVPDVAAGNDSTEEDALEGDVDDGRSPEAEVTDLVSATIESPTLDGRTLTMTALGDVVNPEPSSMALRFASDTFGMTVELIEDGPEDIPGDHEVELVEDRWDGEIRVVSTPEGMPFARYDGSDTSLLIAADQGPSFEPVTSTEEVMDALDRIDIEQAEDGTVVTATDADLEHELLLVYPVDGIDSGLSIVDGDELFARTPIEPVEEPMTGAGGEVVVGEGGYIELSGDEGLVARIQLILPDDKEQQRGLDLMTSLELALDD